MKLNSIIHPVAKEWALDFIQKYHYSPVMPKLTKHFLGFFVDNEPKGVLTLGWGTRPKQTINKLFPGLDTKHYYEIGKMCLSPEFNGDRGAGSQMISKIIQWMKKNTDCLFLYTLADGIMGKCGYVYQAANFYFGEKYWTETYLMKQGERLHIRSAGELTKINQAMENKELERVEGFVFGKSVKRSTRFSHKFMKDNGIRHIEGLMFRYIYPLNKKAKKLMKEGSALNWTRDYPKDDELRWYDKTDKNKQFFIDQPVFSFPKRSDATLEKFFV